MIKITSLNKYYNKNRQNEIHVINGVNLVFSTMFNDGVTEGIYYFPQIEM